MAFYPDERLVMLIDGPNFHATVKGLEFDIDFSKLREYFAQHGRLIRAQYYTALAEDAEFNPIQPLVDWLDYNGFYLVTKPAKEFTDAQGIKRFRGNMDVEIAVDLVEAASFADHIIVCSGNGNLFHAVETAQRKGARVTVVSTLESQTVKIADDLRRQADQFIELEQIKLKVQKAPRNG